MRTSVSDGTESEYNLYVLKEIDRRVEAAVSFPPSMYYTVVPWSQYHNLDPCGGARVFVDRAKAEDYADDAQDVIYKTPEKRWAYRIAEAFDWLCVAAWTPNQTAAEQEKTKKICSAIDRFFSDLIDPMASDYYDLTIDSYVLG